MTCPTDSADCKAQTPPPDDEGCGKELDPWFTKKALEPKTGVSKPILMSALPQACRQVLTVQ
jgi:penicillin-insensitive murein endopeptidase